MRQEFTGRVWKFGDNIDTDVIIPARYLNTSDPAELAQHCMEDADPEFTKKIAAGDIIVAGTDFGCGSSREHAPVSIKAAGISCVIAKSFARIFFRNAINIGLPIFECAEAVDDASTGDTIRVNPEAGTIVNVTKGRTYRVPEFPPFMRKIIDAGGLTQYVKARLAGG